MTVYALTYKAGSSKGLFHELSITTHPDKGIANAYVNSSKFSDPSWSGLVVEAASDLSFGGPMLVQLFNHLRGSSSPEAMDHVKKFESRARGQERVFALIEENHLRQPHADFEAPAKGEEEASAAEGSSETTVCAEGAGQEGVEDMASKKKSKKAPKAKKPAGEKKPRGKGVSAGKVADFRQVREGTDRQKVLKLMNGQHTAEQIAQELKFGESGAKKVGQIAFCISRDCGIGYSFGAKGQLVAEYPTGKSYKDAVKKAAAE